jgi:APA family basic amino acid/polyamine antiporter
MPFAMAEDGYLPPFLTRKHSKYGTPAVAIVISSAIYASLALHTLTQLISIYNWLRASTTVLTVLAVLGMRRKHPELTRAFKVPAGRLGLAYVVGVPIAMTYVALRYSDPVGLRWGPPALALGPVAYVVTQWFARRAARAAAQVG